MNHVILPLRSAVNPTSDNKDRWVELTNVSLGGCFYDYLRSVDAEIVGVRYWLIGATDFSQHPVYSQFLDDDRFDFDQAGGYVDILFDESSVPLLKERQLTVDVVQDFGGEGVLRCGERLGILFALAIDS